MKSSHPKSPTSKAVKRNWRKDLRELIAEAFVMPLQDLAAKTSSEKSTQNIIAARDKIIRYVEKLIAPPHK